LTESNTAGGDISQPSPPPPAPMERCQAYNSSTTSPECPRKDCRGDSCQLHLRESAPAWLHLRSSRSRLGVEPTELPQVAETAKYFQTFFSSCSHNEESGCQK